MRTIDADGLKKQIMSPETWSTMGVKRHMCKIIDNAPTVEPTFKPIAEVKFDKEQLQEIIDKAKAEILESVERQQGYWIEDSGNIACSHCHAIWLYRRTAYCPNCGAQMNGGEDHD